VAGDPAGISRAPVNIIIMNIQYPGCCLGDADSITAMSMLNSLWLAGCSGGIEDEQPVLWI